MVPAMKATVPAKEILNKNPGQVEQGGPHSFRESCTNFSEAL